MDGSVAKVRDSFVSHPVQVMPETLRITCSLPARPISRSPLRAALDSISLTFRTASDFLWAQQASVHDLLSEQQLSAHGDLASLQGDSAQGGFLVGAAALVGLDAQYESADAQDAIEVRAGERLLWREGRRNDAQQDSWPRASKARQMQPKASSLNWY